MGKTSKAMRTETKDARRGVTEQAPLGGKSQRETPVEVQCRWTQEAIDRMNRPGLFQDCREWRRFGRYRDIDIANKVVESQQRKDASFEYRVKPEEGKK